jgi:serine/threonine protein phosphatase PrpC
VCRTFGDIEAKLPRLCGNPNVVIVDPDISSFKIEKDKHDFVALGCDGIFDKLEDKDLVHTVWQSVINKSNTNNSNGNYDHRLSGQAVDAVLKTSALRRSADNITVVFVAFDNFYKLVEEAKGDLTKFEPGQIELQLVEVIQPPEKMTSGQHTKKSLDILIEEDMPSAVDVTPKEEFVVGDTGDSSF